MEKLASWTGMKTPQFLYSVGSQDVTTRSFASAQLLPSINAWDEKKTPTNTLHVRVSLRREGHGRADEPGVRTNWSSPTRVRTTGKCQLSSRVGRGRTSCF